MASSLKQKTIVQAIEDKYGSNDEMLAIEIFVPKGAPGQKDTGEIVVPQELSLDGCGISCAGDKAKINELCGKKVTFLGLSENFLSDWTEVFKILDEVPMCSFLDLRQNPLSQKLTCELQSKTYPLLSKLVLNNLRLSWDTVTSLLQLFPSLMELHLSLNGYDSVHLDGQTYPCLQSLHFSNNSLQTWSEVAKLGKAFPNLESLFLWRNPLCEFPDSIAEDVAHDFTKLKSISINETQMKTWEQLEKLRKFPCLTELRAIGIDFLEAYQEELRRQLIMAYLPNIERLNGGRVTEGEKEDAERAFIRHYLDKDGTIPDRYHELEAKHGKLDPLVEIQFDVPKYVSVTCHFKEKTFLKRLDLKWTLIDLKRELEGDVGLPSSQMTLFHEQTEPYLWSDTMLYPKRTVLRYGIEDGHRIFVNENTAAAKINFLTKHSRPASRTKNQ